MPARHESPRDGAAVRAVAGGALLLFAFILVLPEYFSGHLMVPAWRLAPVALLLTSLLLPPRFSRPWPARILLILWCFGVLGATALLAVRFDRQMDGFVNVARQMEPHRTAVLLLEGAENDLFYHALAYYHLEKGGLSPRIWLVTPSSQHSPARLLPPFPWGDIDWEKSGPAPLTGPAGRAFDYVVVKTWRTKADPLPPAPPYHRLQARYGGWLLYERRGDL